MRTQVWLGMGIAVVFVGLGVWMTGWEPGSATSADGEPPGTEAVELRATSETNLSATGPDPAPALVEVPMLADLAQIDAILRAHEPRGSPLMREVPPFGPEVEAVLVARYSMDWRWQTIEDHPLVRQYGLLSVLAYRGGSASVPVLTNALRTQHQVDLSTIVAARCTALPSRIGILATREEAALRFLLDGLDPDYWWRLVDYDPNLESVRWFRGFAGRCLKGVALSGRPEAQRLLDYYHQHPEAVFLQDDRYYECLGGSSVVDAAFYWRSVEEFGLEWAMDEMLRDERALWHLRKWKETEDGQRWEAWWDRGIQMRRELDPSEP